MGSPLRIACICSTVRRLAPATGDTTPAVTRDLRDMIIETIPLDQRHLVPSWVTARWTPIKRLKQRIKKVTPPVIQRIISATRG